MATLDLVILWLEHIMALAWGVIAVNSISGWSAHWKDLKQNVAYAREGKTQSVSTIGSGSSRPLVTLVFGWIIVIDFLALIALLALQVVLPAPS